ncbi:hypothetical protein JL722_8484 [Aureococcus anophagefferens]|nr:hypothetical protein JL722_8484 [Aureococcus anophagefferens]
MREKLARGAPDELMALMRASPRVNPTAARASTTAASTAPRTSRRGRGAVAEILCRGAAFEEGADADDAARGSRAPSSRTRAAVAADARDYASDDDGDGGDSDEDSLPDPDLVVASEDDE